MAYQGEVWVDSRGRLREASGRERWTLWGVEVTIFLPIVAELLADSVPRWYGWVLIGVFLLALLGYAREQLRHAADVIDTMPLNSIPDAGSSRRQTTR